ncbi:hypothetical protein BTR14_09480 [Rhizobium rhizosphaerae]|uniref:tryptophan synthase n=1 Tax=Xaviernesmea rhizosphaerae TaxID=1672749 RepID=A0ABX3PF82_9HYPH|nr:tryptophan synthase subunit alpha [Xaviernesmea rhizosphaerae]OQP86665.1 hypothetical protein BTR14_09480 [Xaviernesmea rhizosphaerae]
MSIDKAGTSGASTGQKAAAGVSAVEADAKPSLPAADSREPAQATLPVPLSASLTGRPLLSCYFPLGDPAIALDCLDLYAGEGVDVLEIGMAAPDPFLDGADVRASMARADRTRWRGDLDAVLDRLARLPNPPRTLLMTYVDPAHPGLSDTGLWRGMDSLLAVSRPNDPLAARLEASALSAGTALSAFVALPPSPSALMRARQAGFYVMLQAHDGPTGPRERLDPENSARIASLRTEGVKAPVMLGFGISTGEQARAARDLGADGVVVGSQVLRAALAGPGALRLLLREMRSGLDA